jgi:hypothetical protein
MANDTEEWSSVVNEAKVHRGPYSHGVRKKLQFVSFSSDLTPPYIVTLGTVMNRGLRMGQSFCNSLLRLSLTHSLLELSPS